MTNQQSYPSYDSVLLRVIQAELNKHELVLVETVDTIKPRYRLRSVHNTNLFALFSDVEEINQSVGYCIRKYGAETYCDDKFLPFSEAFKHRIITYFATECKTIDNNRIGVLARMLDQKQIPEETIKEKYNAINCLMLLDNATLGKAFESMFSLLRVENKNPKTREQRLEIVSLIVETLGAELSLHIFYKAIAGVT